MCRLLSMLAALGMLGIAQPSGAVTLVEQGNAKARILIRTDAPPDVPAGPMKD